MSQRCFRQTVIKNSLGDYGGVSGHDSLEGDDLEEVHSPVGTKVVQNWEHFEALVQQLLAQRKIVSDILVELESSNGDVLQIAQVSSNLRLMDEKLVELRVNLCQANEARAV